MIPSGYRSTETFSETGGLVTVPAGAGYLGALPTVLVSRTAPSGVSVYLSDFFCRAMDIDLTQISFGLRVNGAYPISGLAKIAGVMTESGRTIVIGEKFPPGYFEIVAFNLSGTGLTGAQVATSPFCQASWNGVYLVSDKPLRFSNSPRLSVPKVLRGFLK